jgi:multidrug efflux system membrane fusion protein
MYARVGITASEKPDAIVVPTNAVIDVAGKRGVFLAQDDNVAAFREVEIGIESDEKTEIVSGVSAGDRVITTGAAALRDGDRFLLEGEDGGAGSVPSGGRAGRGAGRQGVDGGRQGGGRRGGQQSQGQ